MFFKLLKVLPLALLCNGCSALQGILQDVAIVNKIPVSQARASISPAQVKTSPSPQPTSSARLTQTQPPTISAPPAADGSVKLELRSIKTLQARGRNGGNGDQTVNQGETISIQPILVNMGNSPSNKLKIRLSSLSPDLQILKNLANKDPILAQEVSNTLESTERRFFDNTFEVKIALNPSLSSIPLVFTVFDDFGNEWKFEHTLAVDPIDNKIELLKVVESGYADFVFQNTGKSDTNNLRIKSIKILETANGTAEINISNEGYNVGIISAESTKTIQLYQPIFYKKTDPNLSGSVRVKIELYEFYPDFGNSFDLYHTFQFN